MPLTPGESDRLLLHTQAGLAQRRRDRGLRLNVPEARALIADAVCEWARDGLDLPATLAHARALLAPDDVLPGVAEALDEVRVEARFDDGTRLVVVKDPIVPPAVRADEAADTRHDAPPATAMLDVVNEAATAIGLSSHVHLAEVNPRLRLDRAAAFGMHLAVAAGETVWLAPGEQVTVAVRPIGGARVAIGTSGVVEGALDDPDVRARALALLRSCGYLDVVDGVPVGDAADAEAAVPRLVAARREPVPRTGR